MNDVQLIELADKYPAFTFADIVRVYRVARQRTEEALACAATEGISPVLSGYIVAMRNDPRLSYLNGMPFCTLYPERHGKTRENTSQHPQ